MATPELVFVFSGKRKTGKDYVADLLQKKLSESRCGILRLSAPLKKQYALDNNIAYEQLLDSSPFKEKFRAAMIKWGEEKRDEDPGYFCRLATSCSLTTEANKPIWIISDARRPTDIEYFHRTYPHRVRTVRIVADERVRQQRGFSFVAEQICLPATSGFCLKRFQTMDVIKEKVTRQLMAILKEDFEDCIDDAVSECGLDGFQQWDFTICNDGDAAQLDSQINAIIQSIPTAAKL